MVLLLLVAGSGFANKAARALRRFRLTAGRRMRLSRAAGPGLSVLGRNGSNPKELA